MLKHQLYPLIESYIKEYLHGFTKRQLEISITKGELKLQYLNLRPDTINKKMDENNFPFWLKAGLIKKISIGCSVMNIIGEIPLELKIDGLDIILNPSYKWFLRNFELNKKNNFESQLFGDFLNINAKNPLNINFKNNTKDFDTSIFSQIKELFKDKTLISNKLNIIYEKCYQFYLQKNTSMSIKINNIHIRFEDDYFINYNDNLVFGIRIDNIDIKLGKKSNMKKNSITISKFDLYWENPAKILIPTDFLYSLYIDGEFQESYYSQLQDIKFQNFNYEKNTKFIIENFNCTINFGTKIINHSKNIDIFSIKDKPCILYIQISTSDIILNLWPEFVLMLNNLKKFKENYDVVEKIEKYRPKNKPFIKKEKSNFINSNNNSIYSIKNRKLLVRNWLFYFIFNQKMKKFISTKNENEFRIEFLRYYNIFCKKIDINEKITKKEEKKENLKTNKIIYNEDIPIKIIQNDNNMENSSNLNGLKNSKINKKNNFDFFALGKNNSKTNKPLLNNNKSISNINTYLNEQKRKQFEENVKLKNINLSLITDILIKSINININPSLNKDNINYLKFKIKEIQTKISLSKEKFDLYISSKNIDFSPYNSVYGERQILSDESYRKLYQEPQENNGEYETLQNWSNPYFITTEFNNNINNNIGQESDEKIKIINDALSFAEINNNSNKRSRGSSLGSNRYGNNNIDNFNYRNTVSNKKINNRPLNTVGNNYPQNYYDLNNSQFNINNNQKQNYRYSSIENNPSIINYTYNNNNIYMNKKSFINFTLGRKTDGSFLAYKNENKYSSLSKTKLTKKQKKELYISQAVNNYNTYKIRQRSITPSNLINNLKNRINYNNKNKRQPFSNKNTPLNLLEIYSNSNNSSLSLRFTKYNNPVSIDSFQIKIGTIRTNLFVNYLSESLKIFKEYSKFFNSKDENNIFMKLFEQKAMEKMRQLFNMKQYFYKNISRLPDNRKTESMIKYGEYLRKEIFLMKIYNSKIEDFQINYIFSMFNNGFKFNMGFENLECVYYSRYKKISGKFILPSNEFEIVMSLKKIIIKVFGMELEINDLEDTKLIFKKIKKMFEDKLSVAEIMMEPCFTLVKKELEKESNKIEEKKLENYNIKLNEEIINNNIINTNSNNENNILINNYQKNISEDFNKNNLKIDNPLYYNEEDKK